MRARWVAIAGLVAASAIGACDSGNGIVPYRELPVPEDVEEEGLVTEEQANLEMDFIDVPRTLTLGSELRYVVELRNTSDEAVPLDPCPVYYQAWGESGFAVSRTSYLNCDSAPPQIPAGKAVRFEMRLPIEDPEAVHVVGSIVWYIGHPGSPIEERMDVAVSGETDVVPRNPKASPE